MERDTSMNAVLMHSVELVGKQHQPRMEHRSWLESIQTHTKQIATQDMKNFFRHAAAALSSARREASPTEDSAVLGSIPAICAPRPRYKCLLSLHVSASSCRIAAIFLLPYIINDVLGTFQFVSSSCFYLLSHSARLAQ